MGSAHAFDDAGTCAEATGRLAAGSCTARVGETLQGGEICAAAGGSTHSLTQSQAFSLAAAEDDDSSGVSPVVYQRLSKMLADATPRVREVVRAALTNSTWAGFGDALGTKLSNAERALDRAAEKLRVLAGTPPAGPSSRPSTRAPNEENAEFRSQRAT